MKYHNKGGSYRLGQPSPHRYTKWINERASNFEGLKSANHLTCLRPNKAVRELVDKVVQSLENNKDSSKAIKFFDALEESKWRYHLSDWNTNTKESKVRQYKNKFNLTDIIKEINNEIKVQCEELEKGSNKCYKNMNTKIKESTKKIFYDQIVADIHLIRYYSEEEGRHSFFVDFYPKDEDEFQDFVKNVPEEESADVPPEESADDPASEGSADVNKEESGGRRRRRRTASKRKSTRRRSTRKRSSKRRGGKKSGKRKTMKRKQ